MVTRPDVTVGNPAVEAARWKNAAMDSTALPQHAGATPTSNVPLISVVAPVYGCGASLGDLVDQVSSACAPLGTLEIVLVDDASPDGAWAKIERLAERHANVVGIRLSRNFGQHAAISAGIANTRGEWVVVMDCDLQDPPAAIPDLYGAALEQDVSVVFGQRMDRQDLAIKRFASWSFHKALSWLTGTSQDPSTANFGIFHRRVIDAVVAMPERTRTFPLIVAWTGFPRATVPVQHGRRASGESGYTFKKMISLAVNVILSYSEKPLRLVASGGLICSLIAFTLVAISLYHFFTGSITVAGYTSVMASIWLLGGLVLFSLGVVGLYVGQVFRNVQGRPSWIVAEEVGPTASRATPPADRATN